MTRSTDPETVAAIVAQEHGEPTSYVRLDSDRFLVALALVRRGMYGRDWIATSHHPTRPDDVREADEGEIAEARTAGWTDVGATVVEPTGVR